MDPWVWKFLVAAALALAALGSAQFESYLAARITRWLILMLVAFLLWWWTGSVALAALGLGLWFGIPAIQACRISRQLRFSKRRRLVAGVIDFQEFPDIHRVAREMRGEGLVEVGDYWLKPSPVEQGFRLFAHPQEPILAARAVMRPGDAGIDYDLLLTVDEENRVWITWNPPMSLALAIPQDFYVLSRPDIANWAELWHMHREFLQLNAVCGRPLIGGPQDRKVLEYCLRRIMDYNVRCGILGFREGRRLGYTWRGTLRVGWQVICDMMS